MYSLVLCELAHFKSRCMLFTKIYSQSLLYIFDFSKRGYQLEQKKQQSASLKSSNLSPNAHSFFEISLILVNLLNVLNRFVIIICVNEIFLLLWIIKRSRRLKGCKNIHFVGYFHMDRE